MKNYERYKTVEEQLSAFWEAYPIPMMPHEAVEAFSKWLVQENVDAEMLPCPFCGSHVMLVNDPNAMMSRMKWIVQCLNCSYEYRDETREKTVLKHNRVSHAVNEHINKEEK